jgi:hypothetical protein
MYKKLTQCENWEEILNLMTQITNENEQLKAEKQLLSDELTSLKTKINQTYEKSKSIMGEPFASPKIVKLIEELNYKEMN